MNETESQSTNKGQITEFNFEEMELDQLIDYIFENHHQYDREILPLMLKYSTQLSSKYGDEYPELIEINELTESLYTDLMNHMIKEETILFPMIRELVKGEEMDATIESCNCNTIEVPIKTMGHEHNKAKYIFSRLRQLTNDYRKREPKVELYQDLLKLMEEFETDIHHHVYLEDEILFPRAKDLENKLNKI